MRYSIVSKKISKHIRLTTNLGSIIETSNDQIIIFLSSLIVPYYKIFSTKCKSEVYMKFMLIFFSNHVNCIFPQVLYLSHKQQRKPTNQK